MSKTTQNQTPAQPAHTPGPWEVIYEPTLLRCRIGAGFAAQNTLAEVHIKSTPGESQANARLIAAAPTMLEVLTHCLARLEHGPDANPNDGLLHDVRAAIARATGGAA